MTDTEKLEKEIETLKRYVDLLVKIINSETVQQQCREKYEGSVVEVVHDFGNRIERMFPDAETLTAYNKEQDEKEHENAYRDFMLQCRERFDKNFWYDKECVK